MDTHNSDSQTHEVDQWIKRGLGDEITRMDAAFDFSAGLADVYARAGLGAQAPPDAI